MCSGAGHTTWLVRGSPIRTSSDQRSVDSSPRLIAASYVLHRLLVPRHPPCALNNLATQKPHNRPRKETICAALHKLCYRVRRCSRPLCSSQRTTGHPPSAPAEPRPPTGERAVREPGRPRHKETTPTRKPGRARSLRTQQRAYHRLPHHRVPHPTSHRRRAVLAATRRAGRTGQRSTLELRLEHPRPPETGRPSRSEHGSAPPAPGWRPVLLRKEGIQPHLPVRLPCYDFVPIADPAFDGSLHKGWATGFGRYRLSWRDRRCAHGPGTYSPQRC